MLELVGWVTRVREIRWKRVQEVKKGPSGGRQIKRKGEINWAKSKHLRRKSIRRGRANAKSEGGQDGEIPWETESSSVFLLVKGERTDFQDTLRGGSFV